MTKSKKEASDTLRKATDSQSHVRGPDRQDGRASEKPGGQLDQTYDALDYRLMATFPASDATARY